MCGIVGAVANRNISPLLINGLKKLEYRGYDSAGIALLDLDHELKRTRVRGKVQELEKQLATAPLIGNLGIAHTRWATHGAPSEKNAHPFISHGEFALVHNGIIENHNVLRQELIKQGINLQSDTDTEVIVHLIYHHYSKHQDFLKAAQETVNQLIGAYALAIISKHDPNKLIAVRRGSPLVVGCGKGENYIASDPLALLSVTRDFIYLAEDDLVLITDQDIQIYDKNNKIVKRKKQTVSLKEDAVELGQYQHFMLKEINEQPEAIATCLEGRIALDHILPGIFGPHATNIFKKTEHIQFIACGTSYHACMIARYWIESIAGIPCSVEIASEFRYRQPVANKKSLFVTLSQSGETADTLAALRLAKTMDYLHTLTICNVPESSLIRESDSHFLTRAGIEIGVASTKAFMTQLVSLFLFAITLAKIKNKLVDEELIVAALKELPLHINSILKNENEVKKWANILYQQQFVIFIGRNVLYPIALEAALKMKEISYIHAEGYAAGELKHGPLALIDANTSVIATAPKSILFEKTMSNLEEIHTREGKLFILTDEKSLSDHGSFKKTNVIDLPQVHTLLSPLLYIVPLQLLSYHVAILKGTNVDQPRNLAKSVTVE